MMFMLWAVYAAAYTFGATICATFVADGLVSAGDYAPRTLVRAYLFVLAWPVLLAIYVLNRAGAHWMRP